jgi:hypothetical protein
MQSLLVRGLALVVSTGVVALLVAQAAVTGCATDPPAPRAAAAPANAAPPATSVAAPVSPPQFLPATKAAPVFYPSAPAQQAAH